MLALNDALSDDVFGLGEFMSDFNNGSSDDLSGLSDDQLMKRYQEGEEEAAFTVLYNRHKRLLINYISGITKDRDNAEDIAQETFIRVMENAAKYRSGRAKFTTWMLTIAKNLCLNDLRDRERRSEYMVDNVRVFEPDGDGNMEEYDRIANAAGPQAFEPEEAAMRTEIQEAVQSAINTLPEKYGRPFYLFHIQRMSYEEISTLMELRLSTTKSRINRARQKLAKLLEPFYEEYRECS